MSKDEEIKFKLTYQDGAFEYFMTLKQAQKHLKENWEPGAKIEKVYQAKNSNHPRV